MQFLAQIDIYDIVVVKLDPIDLSLSSGPMHSEGSPGGEDRLFIKRGTSFGINYH